MAALQKEPRHEVRDLIDTHGHADCCYVGEISRVGLACGHREDALRPISVADKSWQVVATTEEYISKASIYDCSIGESAKLTLPSTFIQQAATLSFDMGRPSWLDETGLSVHLL